MFNPGDLIQVVLPEGETDGAHGGYYNHDFGVVTEDAGEALYVDFYIDPFDEEKRTGFSMLKSEAKLILKTKEG